MSGNHFDRASTGWRRCVVFIFSLLCGSAACCQIIVGQTADLSGPASDSVKELNLGAALYLDEINARGGINGQTIQWIQLDDKNDPRLSPENARLLIEDRQAHVLFLSRGTPHTQAILPLLSKHKIALVAPSTGAMILRNPVHPYVFNVRGPYQREAEVAIRHLDTLGVQHIAVLHVDDSFGEDAAIGARSAFAALKKEALLVEKFDRAKLDYEGAISRIVKSPAQAVLIIGSGAAVAGATDLIRNAGSRILVITLSNNASSGFIKLLGKNAHGVIVTQVFPSERSMTVKVVREAHEAAQRRKMNQLSPAMMEGFVSAKVLVQGLRRAGPHPTRERIIQSLNGLNHYDVGGLEIRYSPTEHDGIRFVDMSIITSDGKFRR